MPKPQFVYVTYIVATPERVWEALTSPAFTLQFFGERLESEWTPGAPFRAFAPDGRQTSAGRVVEADPPRRLTIRWETAATPAGPETRMPPAVATLEIVACGDVVRLTVSETHDEPVDEAYLDGGRRGWPIILSRLKTLLETGRSMPPLRAAVQTG